MRGYLRDVGANIRTAWAERDRSRARRRLSAWWTLTVMSVAAAGRAGFAHVWIWLGFTAAALAGVVVTYHDLKGGGSSAAGTLARILGRHRRLADDELRAVLDDARAIARGAGRRRAMAGDLVEAVSRAGKLAGSSPGRTPPDRSADDVIRRAVAIATWEGRERAGTADLLAALAEPGAAAEHP